MESLRGNLLGLDQALRNTGYAILNPYGEIISKGVIKTTNEDNYLKRLEIITTTIEYLICEHEINIVYMEEVFAAGKGAWKVLLEVKILIEMLCYSRHLPCTALSSLIKRKNSWRRIIGLKTSEKKECKLFIGEKNEHIAEAIGIAKAGFILETKK